MRPFTFLSVNPSLSQWVEAITIMNVDFKHSSLQSVYCCPGLSKTHIFLTISEEPLLVKSAEDENFTIYPTNFIIGPRLTNDIINFGSKRHVVGITFKAGGLQSLIGLPMNELTNKELDASLVFGREIKELEVRLKEAKRDIEVQSLVESFLLKKSASIKNAQPFDRAIDKLVKSNGNIPIETIASYAGISLRQLERNCQLRLGIAPKLFARLIRFSGAYMLKEKRPYLGWANIAYEFGYFDQMHLIRDFKSFSGYTPTVIETMLPSSVKIVTALESSC